MIVIDDGSPFSRVLEAIVREDWPNAVFVREPRSAGCPQRRSEGFLLAKGEYILEIDNDPPPSPPMRFPSPFSSCPAIRTSGS